VNLASLYSHKVSIGDLAIFGGQPAFSQKLHVGRPNIGDRQKLLDRFNDLLDRLYLTNDGPFVHELEQRIADMVGVRYCIAMCNATVALEIAIRALGMTGEVIVPSFTFIATAHALEWLEITPVFCDVDPLTHNIDPHKVLNLLTPRTSGIIGVHLWGRACDVETLSQIAREHNLALIFDAAHAFACTHEGQMIGNFGHAEVFSFHATKFLNSFEGGAVVTNDADLAKKIRLMKNFGFIEYDDVRYIGTNGKMSEVSAAMGLTSLESIDLFIGKNYDNYHCYRDALGDLPGIEIIQYNEHEKNNCQYVVLEIDEQKTGIDRNRLVKILHAENVIARRYFYPGCHRMEPYRSLYPNAGLLLPHTERLVTRVMSLPNGMTVGSAEITALVDIFRFILANSQEIVHRLDG
jgi:dTDP-4-amino-4,6-dideoxygalactose transaminase